MAFQLATNLEMGAKIPLDTRAVVATIGERNAITQAYPGLTVYVTGENKYYYYDTNNSWVEFGSSQNLVYTTGDQTISGVKSFKNSLVFSDNLLYLSQASGQIIQSQFSQNYSGYYDGGNFLGRMKLSQNNIRLTNIGNTWSDRRNGSFISIAMSSDGKYQTAGEGSLSSPSQSFQFFTSTDYGKSWIISSSESEYSNWCSVSVSSDGKYQAISSRGTMGTQARILFSQDYGNKWVNITPNFGSGVGTTNLSVSISSNGQYICAVSNSTNFIFISKDYGETWVQISIEFSSGSKIVKMSSDGKYITILDEYASPARIHISNNYGMTWNTRGPLGLGFMQWEGLAISSDGKYQAASLFNGDIYISKDYGETWNGISNIKLWYSLDMSADGKIIVACTTTAIFISETYGNTWTQVASFGSMDVAMSSDGKYITNVNNTSIYTSKADELIDGNFIADNLYGNNLVYTTGDQTISGDKTFSTQISVNNIRPILTGIPVVLNPLYIDVYNGILGYNINSVPSYGLDWKSGILSSNNGAEGWKFTKRPTVNGTGVLLQGEGGGVSSIINTTYSTLTGLKAVTGLTPGQLYRISDFHLTWYNQSINDTGVKSGLAPEPLIVLALSGNKISHEAKSEIYPQDTVYYDIDASGSYSWGALNNNRVIPNFKGWIYRRIDHQLNIDIGWDWRNITVNCCRPIVTGVPRWTGTTNYNQFSVVRGTGINNTGKLYYSSVVSNSGNVFTNTSFWLPVSDFVEGNTYFSTDESFGFRAYNKDDITFVNLPADQSTRIQQPTFTSRLTGQGTFSLTNCDNIKIEGGYCNVIFGNNFYQNTIGNNFAFNTIDSDFYSNTIGDNFYVNTIGDVFEKNTIGNSFNNNTIERLFRYNTIGNIFEKNTISQGFFYNTIGNFFNSNNIGNGFYLNTVGNGLNSNVIGNNFYGNAIGNDFYGNTIGNDSDSNIIGNNFYSNTIGNYFRSNAIANGLQLNTIGNAFSFNTIGNSFYFNTIGNFFSYNTIGNSFSSSTIGNTFDSNTIGNFFQLNTIGNNFQRNTVEDSLSIGNVTGATHVYTFYNTRIFRNSNSAVRLSFFNSSDQLVVTDPTV
jgi:hypothetical protein